MEAEATGVGEMCSGKQFWAALVAICLAVTVIGCDNGDKPVEGNGQENGQKPPLGSQDNTNGNNTDVELPATPEMPKVILTGTHSDSCLVKVGDVMPVAELPDVGGGMHSLADLYGEKLTVVFFWKRSKLYAVAEFEDLDGDIAAPYLEKGVRVIGINVGDSPEQVAAQIQRVDAKFANLLDPNEAFFAQVATEKLPRTYLLDSQGRILWFDLEYSPSTRRNLERGIKFVLGETTPDEAETTSP
jgi:peroxiredoxin